MSSEDLSRLMTTIGTLVGEGRDDAICDQSIAEAYRELRALAQRMMGDQPPGHTLQATALVHEAFLKLDPSVQRERQEMIALATVAMRHVLVDHARRRRAAKRGGDRHRVTVEGLASATPIDVLELESCLESLERLDPRQARIVELRCYGGMTIAEVSGLLEISTATVEREWRAARAWLAAEMEDGA